MSTYTSEPGTRLAGRYRLVDQVAAGSGWTMWKATDETLARPVSVLTFAPGFPRVLEVVTAARAASRLADSRLAQVFDVEDNGDQAYIVMEWVGGDTLADLLTDGPLDPGRACGFILEAAQALAGAHAAGLAHLRLTPQTLRWTYSSGVKITGLGIDAALAGAGLANASDPALTDTRDLAALLYAGLTGYWPGESQTGLPPAPATDQGVCTPHQVSAAVPPAVDAVVTRALLQRQVRQAPPILTPMAFADALATVAPPVPPPDPAQPPAPRGAGDTFGGGYRGRAGYPDPDNPDTWASNGDPAAYQRRYRGPRTERSAAARAMISVVIVLVLAAVATAAWAISNSLHKSSGSGQGGGGSSASGSGTHGTSAPVLTPASASSFNILGTDDEDAQNARDVISSGPPWHTDFYASAKFGNLKAGTGFLVDMGRPVKLSQVDVRFGTQCCATAQIYLGNSSVKSPSALHNFTLVSPSARVSGNHVFSVTSNATGRFILVWFTSLPPQQGSTGQFEALIYHITVRGTAANGAG